MSHQETRSPLTVMSTFNYEHTSNPDMMDKALSEMRESDGRTPIIDSRCGSYLSECDPADGLYCTLYMYVAWHDILNLVSDILISCYFVF